jgi:Mrp family chromosome partitioning ATPase
MANPTSRNQSLRPASEIPPPERSFSDPANQQYQILLNQLLTAGYGTTAMQTVGLTSSQSGEGVTTVACNLALYAASCQQMNVLLVDANFTKPGLDRIFQLPRSPGLTDLWSGIADEMDCIHDLSKQPIKSWPPALKKSFRRRRRQSRLPGRTQPLESSPSLSVLPVGSNAMVGRDFSRSGDHGFLEPVCAEFDLVIVDLPAISSATSRWISVASLDGILFVVEAEQTSDIVAQKSLLEIQQQGAHVLGIALNRCRNHLPKWIDKKLGT